MEIKGTMTLVDAMCEIDDLRCEVLSGLGNPPLIVGGFMYDGNVISDRLTDAEVDKQVMWLEDGRTLVDLDGNKILRIAEEV